MTVRVDAGVQQRHRAGVAEHVRVNAWLSSDGQRCAAVAAWVATRRSTASRVRRRPVRVGNSGSSGWPARSASQTASTAWASLGERERALLAAFAVGADVRAGAERRRRRSRAPISSETRSPVWMASVSIAWSRRPTQRLRSGASISASDSGGEEGHECVGRIAWAGSQHARDHGGVFGVAQRGVAEQRADRGQPQVAGAGAVGAVVSRGGRGTRRSAARRGRPSPAPTGDCRCGRAAKHEQQPERVAVGGDRVRAGVQLADQPVGEERLQRRGERVIAGPPGRRRAPGGVREQLRRGREVLVGVGGVRVPEVGRQRREQARWTSTPCAVPAEQRAAPRTCAGGRAAAADTAHAAPTPARSQSCRNVAVDGAVDRAARARSETKKRRSPRVRAELVRGGA